MHVLLSVIPIEFGSALGSLVKKRSWARPAVPPSRGCAAGAQQWFRSTGSAVPFPLPFSLRGKPPRSSLIEGAGEAQ